MTNLNGLVYFCKEVFDENSEPTKFGNVNILLLTFVLCY